MIELQWYCRWEESRRERDGERETEREREEERERETEREREEERERETERLDQITDVQSAEQVGTQGIGGGL